jgi:hypothetical protein
MADRVNTAEDPVEPADAHCVVDHIVAHRQEAHLFPGDDAVLLRSQPPQPFVALSGASFP